MCAALWYPWRVLAGHWVVHLLTIGLEVCGPNECCVFVGLCYPWRVLDVNWDVRPLACAGRALGCAVLGVCLPCIGMCGPRHVLLQYMGICGPWLWSPRHLLAVRWVVWPLTRAIRELGTSDPRHVLAMLWVERPLMPAVRELVWVVRPLTCVFCFWNVRPRLVLIVR